MVRAQATAIKESECMDSDSHACFVSVRTRGGREGGTLGQLNACKPATRLVFAVIIEVAQAVRKRASG